MISGKYEMISYFTEQNITNWTPQKQHRSTINAFKNKKKSEETGDLELLINLNG